MVPVPGWIFHLEIIRHPHQMKKLTNVEEPILDGVGGKDDVLGDDSREVIPHELGAVVPVALLHAKFYFHLLQVLDKCSATSFLIQRPFCIRIMFYEPADAFI